MRGQRDFLLLATLLLATLAAAATAPTFAQTAVLAAGAANSSAPGSAAIPDLSGTWGHISYPGFEPPPLGPGPVVNKSRARQVFGPFVPGAITPLVSNVYQLIGDYTNPTLKPQAAETVKKYGEIGLSGVPAPTPDNQCWPGGVPFVFWNIGMRMIQQPDKITILYAFNHEFRQVRLNAPHPAQVTPSWFGDSVGHYQDNALVIDTIGIKIGPFAMVDHYGTPHTEALHVVERYRIIDYEAAKEALERDAKENFRFNPAANDSGLSVDPNFKGKYLQLQLTVEDKGVFTTPWSATVTYRPASGEWPEWTCAENPHGYFPGKKATIPAADKPDF